MTQVDSIVRAIGRHARSAPRRVAIRMVDPGRIEAGETVLDYATLDERARRLAVRLLDQHAPGERALLAHAGGVELVVAFIGCLYAGLVPLHPALPRPGRPDPGGPGHAALHDADLGVVLTDAARRERTEALVRAAQLESVPRLVTDRTDVGAEPVTGCWDPPPPAPDALAFLQYTSGSTGAPRGVMITHRSLAHNVRTIVGAASGKSDETFAGWLPLHHDMGLVGQLLAPLYHGGTSVMLAPTEFVRHPVRWLQLLHDHGAAHTAAPTFALRLCCRRVRPEQVAALDLSGLRVVLVGAEPVDAPALAAFAGLLAPAGFDPVALTPAYGLAESTLMVTAKPLGTAYRTAVVGADPRHPAVSCGPPRDADVRIVDPDTRDELPAGRTGEIWVRGDSVAAGYWRSPDITHEVFGARTAAGDGPFLRTGDLGLLLDGELYVTGRLKEVIVVRGRNLHPHDAERVVAGRHPAFDGLAAAVFSVALPTAPDGEEIVVVQELRPADVPRSALPEILSSIRQGLGETLGVTVPNVALVPAGSIPRTTSGKVQRLAMRERFLAGALRVVHEDVSNAVRDHRATGAAR